MKTTSFKSSSHLSPGPYLRMGWVIVLLGFIGVGLWLSSAPLSSAAIAVGSIEVVDQRQTLSHPTGGTIKWLGVKEGDTVSEGQALVVLDDPLMESERNALRNQAALYQLKLIRLKHQVDNQLPIQWPNIDSALSPEQLRSMQHEQERLLHQILTEQSQQQRIIESQHAQALNHQISLQAGMNANTQSLTLLNRELVANKKLLTKGYVSETRVLELERLKVTTLGEINKLTALNQKEQKRLTELRLAIEHSKTQFLQQSLEEQERVASDYHRTSEKLAAHEKLSQQIVITAPKPGKIINLSANTIGGVAAANQPLMELVPIQAPLIAELKLDPVDIDSVQQGQQVFIRLSAYSFRQQYPIQGVVKNISADTIEDKATGLHHYLVYAELDMSSPVTTDYGLGAWLTREPILGPKEIVVGMPIEAQIVLDNTRTALDYLLEPLLYTLERGMREI